MAIQVRCQCGKTYNLGDDKAGKRFRCQACQEIVEVPDSGMGGQEEAFEEDFGGGTSRGDDEGDDENPYAAPRQSSRKSGKKGRQKVPDLPLGLGWWLFAWQRGFNFEARARRREFWFFTLYNFLISLTLNIGLLAGGMAAGMDQEGASLLAAIPSNLFGLAALIPNIAVGVRRLHDIGKSGWWLLLHLVCVIGGLILLIWNFTDSEDGTNQWGPCPK